MLVLNSTFNSHVINVSIEGYCFSHYYTNSISKSEWVNNINIGGEPKYILAKDLTLKYI